MCLNEENIPFTLKSKNFQTIIMPITIWYNYNKSLKEKNGWI
jgi:hypothetical protein